MCVLANLEYLSILFCAVFWAAAPGLVAVLPLCVVIIIVIIIITNEFYYDAVESKKLQEHLTIEKLKPRTVSRR